MPTDRESVRVLLLLKAAETAVRAADWPTARVRLDEAHGIDPENADVRALLERVPERATRTCLGGER